MLVIKSLDELKDYVGKEIAASDWTVVTQERITQFAEATGDRQWIHLDRERAQRESPFGATIAHGFLTLSLVSYLMQRSFQIRSGVRLAVNYGLNRVRFVSPVREGSRIRGRFQLMSCQDRSEACEAIYSCTIECEGNEKPACVAEWIVRYYK
ncbi:MAG TPA: MaoC family dehydratase [Candidatus Methylomirabilis sp.]|nr:MaoC family dehydratase [Candidatus Methylomirabilis sp.]